MLRLALPITIFSLALGACAGTAEDSTDPFSVEAAAQTATAGALAHDYRGKVAGLDVMLRLASNGGTLAGSYFYVGHVTKGETIVLGGTALGNRFSADESVDGTKTGSFVGTIAPNGKVSGTWTSPNGRRAPFSLEPVKSLTVIDRTVKDSAPVAPGKPFPTCSVDVTYVDVFGLPDAANEAELAKRLAVDVSPLEKNPQGKCDYWNEATGSSKVKLQEKGLLVVEMSAEWDGGAHPSYSLSWINASASTGKVLSLVDIVEGDQMTALRDKAKAVYQANEGGADDFLLETVDRAFESPERVDFELTKEGLRISMFNALPHAAQAEDGDGALLKWADIRGMIVPTSEAAVLAR